MPKVTLLKEFRGMPVGSTLTITDGLHKQLVETGHVADPNPKPVADKFNNDKKDK